MESGSISTSGIGIFHGTVSASSSPPAVSGIDAASAQCTGNLSFSVVAFNDSATSPSTANIQILQSFTNSVNIASSNMNNLGGEVDYSSGITVTDSGSGNQQSSYKQFGEDVFGEINATDDGPINVTLTEGDILTINYGLLARAYPGPSDNVNTSSASQSFDANFGYNAPPGWSLLIVNTDGSPSGVSLNEFPSTAPEPSSWALLGFMIMGLGGAIITAKRKKARA